MSNLELPPVADPAATDAESCRNALTRSALLGEFILYVRGLAIENGWTQAEWRAGMLTAAAAEARAMGAPSLGQTAQARR